MLKNVSNEEKRNLRQLLRSQAHFTQGVEICRALGATSAEVFELLQLTLETATIPEGTGTIGEKGEEEKVEFEEFEMSTTMVTVAQWVAVMGWCPSASGPREPLAEDEKDQRPVVYVSAYEAEEFCRRVEVLYGLDMDVEVRLPHSAEWEYAAQGGEDFVYAGSNDPDEVAWHSRNSGYKLHPVSLKKPNGFGLYDMSGNAYCWTATEWDPDDPSGAAAYRSWIEENGA